MFSIVEDAVKLSRKICDLKWRLSKIMMQFRTEIISNMICTLNWNFTKINIILNRNWNEIETVPDWILTEIAIYSDSAIV